MKYKRTISFLLSIVMIMGCIGHLQASAQQIKAEEVSQTGLSPTATDAQSNKQILSENSLSQIDTQHTEKIEHVKRLRDEEALDTHVFLNSDGSKTLYFYDHPVQYLDAQGKKQDISLDIADSTDAKYPFRTKANSAVTAFPTSLSDGVKLSGHGVELRLAAQLPQSVGKKQNVRRLDEQTVSYTYDDKTTIEYSLTYTGFKEDIVVNSYTGQTEYTFMLYTNGLTLTNIADSYYLTDDAGQTQASIGDVIVFTADERNNTKGHFRVKTIEPKQQYAMTIVLDADYLANPKTVYPIRIDPTVSLTRADNGADAVADVTLHSNRDSGGERTYLLLGLGNSGISRILMKFPGVDFSEYEGVTILSASLKLRDLMCESTQLPVSCYPFTGSDWEEGTASWETVTQTWGECLDTHIISYYAEDGSVSSHVYEFNITEAVQAWVDGDLTITPEKGIIFKAADSIENGTVSEYRTLGSFERSNHRPFFSMTYQSNITLSHTSATMYVGETLNLTATTAPAGQAVTWESEDPTVASVDENGVVTALSEGTATVVATLEDGAIAACDVEILSKSISFEHYDDTELQVYKGNTITLQAETAPVGEPVSWISLNPEIATVSDGVVTGVSVGVAVIQATLTDGSYAQCRVYVQPKEISLNCTNITLYTSDMTTLVAITVPPGEAVTWISMNSQIATVSSDGVVTAVKPGETIIRAIIDDEIYAFCTVTVLERQIALSETRLIMAVEETFDLDAITTPLGQQVLWFTGDSDVAVVNEDGVVCATGLGFTYITASLADMTTVGCYVEVVERELFVDLERNDINEGGTLTISASTIPENRLVVWESSDTSIATVDQNGVVTGIKAGTVTIRAFMPAGPSISITIYITITDGVYQIRNSYSGYYLTVQNGGIANFTDVRQTLGYPSTVDACYRIRQMWKVHYLGEGRYSVRPMNKLDMGLDVKDGNVDIYNISLIDDLSRVPSYCKWTIEWDSTGYVFKNKGNINYTMQIEDSVISLGKTVIVAADSAEERCRWGLTRISSPPSGAYWFDTNTERVVSGNLTDTKYIIYGSTYDIDDLGLIAIAYSPTSNYQTFTWSSSNTAIATINSSTGAIVGKNSGEIKITAKRYINGSYHTLSFNLIVIGADQYGAGVRIANVNGKQYYDFTIPVNALFEDAVALCEDHRCMNWTQYCTWAYDISIFYQPSLSEHKGMQLGSFLWFYQQVNHGAAWDIKRETQWKAALPGLPYLRDEDGKFGDFVFRGAVTTAEGLGNIMYGYTGRAAGFGEITLYWGGGVAAQGSVNSDTVTQPPYYGDTKEDHNNIKLGFDMFNEDYPNYPDVGYDGIPLDGWLAAIADVILNPGT